VHLSPLRNENANMLEPGPPIKLINKDRQDLQADHVVLLDSLMRKLC
jgi:hypothetical protein